MWNLTPIFNFDLGVNDLKVSGTERIVTVVNVEVIVGVLVNVIMVLHPSKDPGIFRGSDPDTVQLHPGSVFFCSMVGIGYGFFL